MLVLKISIWEHLFDHRKFEVANSAGDMFYDEQSNKGSAVAGLETDRR
jgi:hypothetical protein